MLMLLSGYAGAQCSWTGSTGQGDTWAHVIPSTLYGHPSRVLVTIFNPPINSSTVNYFATLKCMDYGDATQQSYCDIDGLDELFDATVSDICRIPSGSSVRGVPIGESAQIHISVVDVQLSACSGDILLEVRVVNASTGNAYAPLVEAIYDETVDHLHETPLKLRRYGCE